MSGSITIFPDAAAARPVSQRLLSRSSIVLAALAREWRLRRELRALESLDSRALQDIGLGRGGLEGAVRHGRGRVHDAPPATPIGVEETLMPPSWTEWR
jgi:uncharacterized protein YjiS (DUF1127 family)